jgi:hypothetical protein
MKNKYCSNCHSDDPCLDFCPNAEPLPVESPSAGSVSLSELQEEADALAYCLEQITEALPVRRDWLDPMMERMARRLIAHRKKQNARNELQE